MKGKQSRRPKRVMRRKARKSNFISNRSGLSPIPSKFITKMKYAEAVTLTGTGLRSYFWNLNSCFDPNRTGSGHQPHGWDQLAGTLYNRYRVFRVDYVLTVANDAYNIHYAALPTNSAAPPITDVSEARENPRCQYAVQNPGGTLKKLVGSISLPKLTGLTSAQYQAGENYQSVYNASPTEIMTLGCFAQGLNDDVGVSMSHTFNILLTYHVELFDPIPIDQS